MTTFVRFLALVVMLNVIRYVIGGVAPSFIYMSHYSHPKAFHLINVADAFIVFALVGFANGSL